MVERDPDQDDYGSEDEQDEEKQDRSSVIIQRFQGMTLDQRADILAKFAPQKVVYDEPLSATQILLLKDADTEQDMIKKVIVKDKLLNPDTLKYAQQESDLHAMVSNHTNVVKLYDQNENEKQFEMYMEYCDKGDYFAEKVQERHTPIGNNQKLLAYAEDVLQGLKYVHQSGVVHADIKLENILKQSAEVEEEFDIVKLCDFGLSNKMDSSGMIAMGKTGTQGYMAPELGKTPLVDSSIDMFSFGILLYELAAAYKPTQVKNYRYGTGPIPFRNVDWRKRNKTLQDLIEQCLQMDPKDRITAADALQHPWFSEETD